MAGKTIKDAVVKSKTGVLTDVQECQDIEILKDKTGKLWVNVDGVCVFRAGEHIRYITVETPSAKKLFS